jgi:hypothetical protein
MEIKVGDKLRCILIDKLPDKEHAPDLKLNEEYTCLHIFLDKEDNQHIDVGLPLALNWITSFETGETLPGTCHWCHPSRFEIIN